VLFILAAIILVGALTLLELRGGDTLRFRALNLQVLVFVLGLRFFVVPLVALSVPISLLDARQMPFWLGAIIFILVGDLLAYLFHRAQHSIPFMWAMHSLHHSDEHMNATTTERHFWGDKFLKAITTAPLAALVIHPTGGIVMLNAALTLWNYVPHANIRLSFGRWSWLLNCPAYHRRHHSILPEHFNSNYAAIFPIFDVIAGSYYPMNDYPPTGLPYAPRGFAETIWWPLREFLSVRSQRRSRT
jgi:sterol desaturase/sphingolipid hydroxylase (fatty acid hydroxylase superfamily)